MANVGQANSGGTLNAVGSTTKGGGSEVYLFIDGAYLRSNYEKQMSEFYQMVPAIRYEQLAADLGKDIHRTYYYDAINYSQQTGETPEARKLQRFPPFQVRREGTWRGRKVTLYGYAGSGHADSRLFVERGDELSEPSYMFEHAVADDLPRAFELTFGKIEWNENNNAQNKVKPATSVRSATARAGGKMPAAIYCRKSTDQTGVSEDQKSVARKVEHARNYAIRRGWKIADQHVCVDVGRRVLESSRICAASQFAEAAGAVRRPDHF